MNAKQIISIIELMAAGVKMPAEERDPALRAAGRMARLLRNARKRDVEVKIASGMVEAAVVYKMALAKHVGLGTADAVHEHFMQPTSLGQNKA